MPPNGKCYRHMNPIWNSNVRSKTDHKVPSAMRLECLEKWRLWNSAWRTPFDVAWWFLGARSHSSKVAGRINFISAVQRVIGAFANGKWHFLACKLHFQVIVVGFLACAGKTWNIWPMSRRCRLCANIVSAVVERATWVWAWNYGWIKRSCKRWKWTVLAD